MRKLMVGIALLLITSIFNTLSAHEDQRRYQHNHDYQRHHNGYAKVLDVYPVYANHQHREYRRGYKKCRSKTGYAGKVVGGVVGGVIGHQIDHKRPYRSHNGATVAGAVVGAVVGHQYDKKHRSCKTRNVSHHRGPAKLVGYNVTYRYRGNTHQTFMRKRPGRHIRINQVRNSH